MNSRAADAVLAPRFLNYAELLTHSVGSGWLVKTLIPADSVGILFGKSGSYKSFIAIDLGLHIAHGLPWCGYRTEAGSVFYIAGEGSGGIGRRISAWHLHHDLQPDTAPFRVCLTPVPLNIQDSVLSVQAAIQQESAITGPPRLIVVDTLSQNYDGDENDNSTMSCFFRNLIASLRAPFPGCSILVIHHPGHSEQMRPRGSSAIRNNTDFLYRLENPSAHRAELICEKMKDFEPPPPQSFQLDGSTLGIDDDGEPITSLVPLHSAGGNDKSCSGRKRAGKHLSTLTAVLSSSKLPESLHELRVQFFARCASEMSEDARRKGFDRAFDEAKANQLVIEQHGGLIDAGPLLEVPCA